MKRLSCVIAVALAGALVPAAAAAGPHECGRIDINYPNGAGGASAVRIRAKGISCSAARPIVRACMRGHRRAGWREQIIEDRTVYHQHIQLSAGRRRITYYPAGGGGCGQ